MFRGIAVLGAAAALAAALWGAGCGDEPAPSQPAQRFRQQILSQFEQMAQPVTQAAAGSDAAALEGLLDHFCLHAFCDPVHKNFGAVVLDDRGRFLAGRHRNRAQGGQVRRMEADRADYSRYRIASRLKRRQVSQARLYDVDGSILVVCVPYFSGKDHRASLCLTFPEDTFHKEWGLSPEEFLALDFN